MFTTTSPHRCFMHRSWRKFRVKYINLRRDALCRYQLASIIDHSVSHPWRFLLHISILKILRISPGGGGGGKEGGGERKREKNRERREHSTWDVPVTRRILVRLRNPVAGAR